MEVRKYHHNDYEYIERIYNASRPDEFYAEENKFVLEPWSDDEYVQSILDESEIYVCEKETVVGFCGFLNTHINWLFVAPEYRSSGVASSLLSVVLPLVGVGATLTVGQSNERANKLYLKFGFIVEKNFVVSYQSKELAVSTLVLKRKCA